MDPAKKNKAKLVLRLPARPRQDGLADKTNSLFRQHCREKESSGFVTNGAGGPYALDTDKAARLSS